MKFWLAFMTSPDVGARNITEGMSLVDGRTPMGVGLHELPLLCRPLVRGRSNSAQKLIKLFPDVRDWVVPGSTPGPEIFPGFKKPLQTTFGSRVNDFCGSLLLGVSGSVKVGMAVEALVVEG